MELNGRYDMQLGSRHVKGMAGGECRECAVSTRTC
jgi:hypothetical protein